MELHLDLYGLDLGGLGELGLDEPLPEPGDRVPCLPHLLHLVPGEEQVQEQVEQVQVMAVEV